MFTGSEETLRTSTNSSLPSTPRNWTSEMTIVFDTAAALDGAARQAAATSAGRTLRAFIAPP
jgi:hypothetical protein